jgi:hypothetical protein
MKICDNESQRTGGFDVMIHATSAGMEGKLPAIERTIFAPDAFAYDLGYAPGDTPVRALGARCGRGTGRTRARHAGRTSRRGVFSVARRATADRRRASRARIGERYSAPHHR